MSLQIGDTARISKPKPARTLKFHDWIGDGWAVFFSTEGFYAVCTPNSVMSRSLSRNSTAVTSS